MNLAEQELSRAGLPSAQAHDVLLSYAAHAGLPRLAMRLGRSLAREDGRMYDAGDLSGRWMGD